ncbi:MAG: hypothetical protein HY820_30705 [Acidobacteria bacterium]|nr:hypothetical protein [Acidobacteriota bacterium]
MSEVVTITGEGKHIVLEFPSLGEALQFWKPWAKAKSREQITGMLHEALRNAGVSLELRVQGKAVALLGVSGMSGLLLRLLRAGE